MRLSLRAKLALVSLALLALPWVGYRYVQEMERFLLEGQRQALLATAKAVATALHERPRLMRLSAPLRVPATPPPPVEGEAPVETAVPVPVEIGRVSERAEGGADSEVLDLLKGVERADARIWVVNRELKVLAVAGSLKPAAAKATDDTPWRRFLGWLMPSPAQDVDDPLDEDVLASGPEITAALLGGVDRVFTIGGAQAVGALAYGTQTIPAVDKICGPGNAYVASAKRRVFGTVGIDMIAGPSEILVLCDGTTDPRWVAMDLFSQAEHDELAQSILLCPDEGFIKRVEEAIHEMLPSMPRAEVIATSLTNRGALVKVRDMAEACAIANEIAPEHLEISALEPQKWGAEIRHAGAIFLGRYTSESLGDYCAGPNHVLPTSRTARFSSPLGVYDFIKRSSVIEVSAEGAQTLGEIAAELAYGEGLQAHARSAEFRMKQV